MRIALTLLDDSCNPDVNFFNENFEVLTWRTECLNAYAVFSVICFLETWLNNSALMEKSLFGIPNFTSINQARGDRKDDGVSIYIYESLAFTVKPDLSINNNDTHT